MSHEKFSLLDIAIIITQWFGFVKYYFYKFYVKIFYLVVTVARTSLPYR